LDERLATEDKCGQASPSLSSRRSAYSGSRHPQPTDPWLSPRPHKSYSLDSEALSPNGGWSDVPNGDLRLVELHSTGSVSGAPPFKGSMLDGKQLQFLATKVVPPRCQGLIERPRLLGITSQLAGKRLAVLKAPAGFGKTSLAASWFERLQHSGNAVAWLTIDTDDDEAAAFLFYVSHALQHACEGVGAAALALIQESFLINPRAIVSTLINDLADVDDEVYLFLEDYHWVSNPAIHEALAFFLRRAPSHCHVVLTTRTEPSLPLASLRAQNQLLEIDAAALRFDLQETRNFLEIERPGALVVSDVRLLREKTEGWPAALRIVASTSTQLRQDFGQYVRNLSGTQRPIGAYLEEMLDGLPRELVQFMVRTAILDRLCAPLCEAVTGAGSSRELLGSIAERQLLLAPLDQEGRWYRYHPLLAEYLTQRLEWELGNEIPGLHQRASLWYSSQELWTDAVQHAIAAGDAVRALDWIKNCAMPLVKRGDLFTLLGWQRLFPAVLMRSQPEIRLAIAWGMALAIRYDEALELLGEIERDIDANPSSDREVVRCECEAIRSVAIAIKDNTEGALSIAQDCLSRSGDPWTANVASNVVRLGHLKRGDLKNFYATHWIPYSLDEDKRNVFASVYYRCIQGMAEAQQLRVAAAERYYVDAVRLAEQYVGPNSVAAALPASLIARVRYEQGRLDEAESMLIDRVPLINAGAMLDCVLSAYFVMARIAVHRMNLERAHTLLESAENQGNTRGWGRLSAAAVLERARLCLNEGRIDEAAECLNRLERLASEYPAPTNCAWSDIHRYAALARGYVASAEQRFEEAISILSGLRRELESVHNLHLALRVDTHLATVRFRAKQVTEALGSFGGIVAAFAKAGIYQTILDEGVEVGPLLAAFQEKAERTGGSRELMPYVSDLLAAWRSRYQSEPQQTPTSPMAEALSAREGDILKLIAEGLSNKEIARNLAITPETVKSHVKHIFTKLNVEKRAQAVSRAQILGLAGTHQ
jgi:LuxR family transcriptional regulator, maltose regulon positive regulatory protein